MTESDCPTGQMQLGYQVTDRTHKKTGNYKPSLDRGGEGLMLKKLYGFWAKMTGAGDEDRDVDPSKFGDPVAMQTDWTPAKSGGMPYHYLVTHKLAGPNPDRLEFQTSTSLKLSYILFLGFGMVGLIVYFCMISFGGWQVDGPEALGPLVPGLVLTITGLYMFFSGTTPIVFDRRCGFFWKGRKHPNHVFDKRNLKYFAELEQIHALQIISKHVQSRDMTTVYLLYELNLVLEDSKRINVIDLCNKDRLREDAETLAAFLDKPIWDAI